MEQIPRIDLSDDATIAFETPDTHSHFFGYYDKSPFDRSGDRMLSHRVDVDRRDVTANDSATVGYWDLDTEEFVPLGETRAFNWQQGSMLQWLPPEYDRRVIYNDRSEDGTGFQAVIVDVETGESRTLPTPIYAIHPSGEYALTANFERLRFCHEASKAGVRTSVEDPMAYHETNTTGLLHLLRAASDHGVRRFVNASSSSVYGDTDYLPYDEDHPTRPQSPYAVTKLAAEHYCRIWDDLYDVATVNLRYFGVYGPRMRPNMAISNFVSRCLNGEPPVIYGDGQQTRDFTYVEDVVDANLALLETDAADGETMNVGSTGNITVEELASYVVDVTGADVEPVYTSARDGEARHTHADVAKARDLIGYEPSVDIRAGVSQFVSWYRENRGWYEPLIRGE